LIDRNIFTLQKHGIFYRIPASSKYTEILQGGIMALQPAYTYVEYQWNKYRTEDEAKTMVDHYYQVAKSHLSCFRKMRWLDLAFVVSCIANLYTYNVKHTLYGEVIIFTLASGLIGRVLWIRQNLLAQKATAIATHFQELIGVSPQITPIDIEDIPEGSTIFKVEALTSHSCLEACPGYPNRYDDAWIRIP
jgi:hypothetical protein